MVCLTRLFFVTTALFLIGCDQRSEEQRICDDYPHLCANLHYDSFCPDERFDLVITREKSHKGIPTRSRALYYELVASEKYRECIGLRSQIRHVQHKKRETNRTEAYLAILEQIKKIEKETKKDKDPYLSYYHWTRHQDRLALDRFIEAEKKNKIDDPHLKVFLSKYYKQRDPEKSLTLLKEAIDKTALDDLNPDWIINVALLSKKIGDTDAYIVHYLIIPQISEQTIDEKQLFAEIKDNPKKIEFFRKAANKLLASLRSQSYKKSNYYRVKASEEFKKKQKKR
tara:strand:+ start:5182 stop:6033 length:852 start_codon:yes stop_codon:yes gene_type:complete